ncbi:MAG TPA: YbaB/EbfC family nucleoid-associated protein [Firmicutes bacterium]|nr:YbaB/EbfC family nucleoid-associated protein [Bacillota bacterium]
MKGPRGLGGVDLGKMMKQVQKLQSDMTKLQEELSARQYEGVAGGGAVKAVVNGQNELLSITIVPDAVEPSDLEMLQDMIVAAVNQAIRKARDDAAAEMSRVTGGVGIPPLPGL